MSKYDYIKEIIRENTSKGKDYLNNLANKMKSSDDDFYASDISNATESLANEINPKDKTELYKKLALALGVSSVETPIIYHLLKDDDEENLENEYLMEIMKNSD